MSNIFYKIQNLNEWQLISVISVFHKIAINQTRPLIWDWVPDKKTNPENLHFGSFILFPFKGQRFAKSFFPNFTKKYTSLTKDTRLLSLEDFKGKLSTDMKPFKYKHFYFSFPQNSYKSDKTTNSRLHAWQKKLTQKIFALAHLFNLHLKANVC